jgi:hypothetical protein
MWCDVVECEGVMFGVVSSITIIAIRLKYTYTSLQTCCYMYVVTPFS